MEISKNKLGILSSDKKHTLYGVIYIPDCEIKGIFHIVHGMTEHLGRYDALMRRIANEGYIVTGYDNLGHGRTVNSKEELGFIAEKNGYDFLVNDVNLFASYIKSQFPDLPYFLFGHSMGSFIVRLAAERFKGKFDKLIVCGTGGPNPAAPFGISLIKTYKKVKGEKHVSNTIDNIAFSTYKRRFDKNDRKSWLTKDKTVTEAYKKDELCQFKFTLSAMQDLVTLSRLSNRKEWFKEISSELPILLVSGSEDPVGNYGKGVKAVYENLKAAGKDVQMHLYENCRHEIHNDTCKDEMFNDIMKFIK